MRGKKTHFILRLSIRPTSRIHHLGASNTLLREHTACLWVVWDQNLSCGFHANLQRFPLLWKLDRLYCSALSSCGVIANLYWHDLATPCSIVALQANFEYTAHWWVVLALIAHYTAHHWAVATFMLTYILASLPLPLYCGILLLAKQYETKLVSIVYCSLMSKSWKIILLLIEQLRLPCQLIYWHPCHWHVLYCSSLISCNFHVNLEYYTALGWAVHVLYCSSLSSCGLHPTNLIFILASLPLPHSCGIILLRKQYETNWFRLRCHRLLD
jgi:hypothetical protein